MYKKHIVVVATALFAFIFVDSAKTQVRNSVYSMFGVGELLDNSLGVNRSLGGTGIAFQSGRSVNYLNPASYLGIPPNSFIMELAVYGMYNKSENRNSFQTEKDINFSYWSASAYFATWWAFSFGILPFSFIDYEMKSTGEIGGELTSFEKTFIGSGGLSRVYLGNSFKIYKGLAAGLNASYIVGPITQMESASINNSLAGYELKNERTVNAMYLDYGLQYSVSRNDWLYTIGVIYGASKELNTTDDVELTSNGITTSLDQNERLAIRIPQKLGLGISVKKDVFRAGLDYEWENWSTIRFSNPNFDTKNSNRYSIGAEFSPGREDGWPKSLSYRLGANYKNAYLEIDNTPISSMGVSVGVGIPYDAISLNVSIEYGEEGTLSKGLIKNSYWVFYLGVSLHEFWSTIPSED
jgi:hypothetical protein